MKIRLDKYLDARRKGVSHKKAYEQVFGLPTGTEEAVTTTQETADRRPIPKDVKMFVWQRDKGQCVECGSNENLEFDHIIPVSKGGSNTERNLQLLCEPCNRQKGASI